MRNKFMAFWLVIVTLTVATQNAMANLPPLDLEGTGTLVAGYIGAAALAGVAILAAMYGIRVIIRAFKSVR